MQLGWIETTDCPSRFSENGTASLIEAGCHNKFVWCGSWFLLEGYSEEECSNGSHCELWRNRALGSLTSLLTKTTKSRLGLTLTVLCLPCCLSWLHSTICPDPQYLLCFIAWHLKIDPGLIKSNAQYSMGRKKNGEPSLKTQWICYFLSKRRLAYL